MKVIIAALLAIIVLSACVFYIQKDYFMRWHNVASGNYYLIAEQGSLLFDDPEILKQYRYQVRSRKLKWVKGSSCKNPFEVLAMTFLCLIPVKVKEKADNTLQLIHRKKGLVRRLGDNQTYSIPYEMYQTGKRLRREEVWWDQDAFLERISQLESIEGVNILRASKVETPVDINPDEEYIVNIYLPLLISPHKADDFSFPEKKIKAELEEHLVRQMREWDIEKYQLTKISHVRHSDITYGKIYLHEYYRPLFKTPDVRPMITGYRADAFALQIKCNKSCAELLESQPSFNWLAEKIPHAEFIGKVKALIESMGGEFNSEFTIADGYIDLSPDYFDSPKRYNLAGKVEVIKQLPEKVRLSLIWQYDIRRALQGVYPVVLSQYPAK